MKQEDSVSIRMSQKTSCCKILLAIALFSLSAQLSAVVQQQADGDPRLRGEWTLEAVEFKIGNNTQRLPIEALLNNAAVRALVSQYNIDDRYYTILFYGNEVGLDLRHPTNNFDRPLKGTYSVANDQLTISMEQEQPHTFTYSVAGEALSISYVQGINRLSLIFKLTLTY
jgi:hypothetical protein